MIRLMGNFQILLVVFAAFISSTVYAATEANIPCTNSVSSNDAIICSQSKRRAAEKQMKTEYDRLINELKLLGIEHLVKDVVTSQRTWLKFRKQYCDVYARSRVEGNSWTTYWESDCYASEARTRAKALKAMSEQDDTTK